jgi:MraZ protein
VGARFFGRFEHSLDVKGRVTLPARFRAHFDTQIYVTQHLEKCLALWTPEEFDKKLAQVEADQDRSPQQRNVARLWSSGLAEVELDRQGRVPLPPYLRSYAGLQSAVLVIGAINRIELWDPTEWDTRVAPAVSDLIEPPLDSPGASSSMGVA